MSVNQRTLVAEVMELASFWRALVAESTKAPVAFVIESRCATGRRVMGLQHNVGNGRAPAVWPSPKKPAAPTVKSRRFSLLSFILAQSRSPDSPNVASVDL